MIFMYSPSQTKSLQQLTANLLDKHSHNQVGAKDINTLRQVLRFHEHRYYILNEPLIADFEYDQLYKELEKLEREDPSLISPDSPTQRVARDLTKDFPSVLHLVPMLSL